MPVDNEILKMSREPPIVIDAAYVERLQGLATAVMRRSPEVADRLLHEIDRAEVVPSGEVPTQVVNIGSRVAFRDDVTGRVQTVKVVLPSDADIDERRVSVLTPIGAALIGLFEGASIEWQTRTGETRVLTVTKVRPPAAPRMRKRRAPRS